MNMEKHAVTIEEVREAQENLKTGITNHENKQFNEAIDNFKKTASIHPREVDHLKQLQQKLQSGGYKLQQESIAYMGCAAVHLNYLVQQLDEDQKGQVPIDESLSEIFKNWEE